MDSPSSISSLSWCIINKLNEYFWFHMGELYVLLDVDGTALLGGSPKHEGGSNHTLFQILPDYQIKKIYLFSDMLLDNTMIDRLVLIGMLEQQGFEVCGVIIPSDVCWDMVTIEDAVILYDFFVEKKVGRWDDKALAQALDTLEIPSIRKALSYSPQERQLGQAFNAVKVDLAKGKISQDLIKKGEITKFICDYLALDVYQYKHPKGLMYDLFLNHIPPDCGSIIIFDDSFPVVETINAFKPVSKDQHLPRVSMVHTPKDKITDSAYYEEQIDAHFFHKTRKLVSLIRAHIDELRAAPRSVFNEDPAYKIAAWQTLIDDLLFVAPNVNQSASTLLILEQFWQVKKFKNDKQTDVLLSGREIMAEQRNKLVSKVSFFVTPQTGSEKLFEQLKKEAVREEVSLTQVNNRP